MHAKPPCSIMAASFHYIHEKNEMLNAKAETELNPLLAVVGFILLVIFTALGIVYAGFVLKELWGWFLVPLGVPALVNGWHALGLMIFLSYPLATTGAKVHALYKQTREEMHWIPRGFETVVTSYLIITLTWGFGWVYHWAMVNHL